MRLLTAVFALGLSAVLCLAGEMQATSKKGVVVTVSTLATDVGVQILNAGGNAVDAAVAVAFAEAVTWPEAGNIGGGGFMMIHPNDHRAPVMIDYRETAPSSAKPNLFADGVEIHHARTAGVPGTVRGLELAHRKYGKLAWEKLVRPAVTLARGFQIDDGLAKRLNTIVKDKKQGNAEFTAIFGKAIPWQAGDELKQPDLAATLKRIADGGADEFYTGDTAKLIAAEMKASDGLVSLPDLQAYKAVERKVLRLAYRGHELLLPPPPSSGGITLGLMLMMLEPYDLKKSAWSSTETVHLCAEAMRRAYCERARFLGDPDFVTLPEELFTKAHAKKLFANFDPNKATPSASLAPELEVRDGGPSTTHFSIIDAAGMCVSNTYTLENTFGCRVVVRGAGFILNNEMTDFNQKPGVTTTAGLIGTAANVIAPGKRMLSSMTPVIVLKDGKPVIITGSPGGRTIINTVLTVLVNRIDYGTDGRSAVDAPRLHMQWYPDRIALEKRPNLAALTKALEDRGHTVRSGQKQGDAHSIFIDLGTGVRTGVADTRLSGSAGGEDDIGRGNNRGSSQK